MSSRLLLAAALMALLGGPLAQRAGSQSRSPEIPSSAPPLPAPDGTAPLEVRIANAKSVKVQTSILGGSVGSGVRSGASGCNGSARDRVARATAAIAAAAATAAVAARSH